mgnify:CR=1 FL=1
MCINSDSDSDLSVSSIITVVRGVGTALGWYTDPVLVSQRRFGRVVFAVYLSNHFHISAQSFAGYYHCVQPTHSSAELFVEFSFVNTDG